MEEIEICREDALKAEAEAVEEESFGDDTDMPGTLASLIPLAVPLLLIVGNTTFSMLLPEGSIVTGLTVTFIASLWL